MKPWRSLTKAVLSWAKTAVAAAIPTAANSAAAPQVIVLRINLFPKIHKSRE
jgi:hypothetical protein